MFEAANFDGDSRTDSLFSSFFFSLSRFSFLFSAFGVSSIRFGEITSFLAVFSAVSLGRNPQPEIERQVRSTDM